MICNNCHEKTNHLIRLNASAMSNHKQLVCNKCNDTLRAGHKRAIGTITLFSILDILLIAFIVSLW